VSVRLEGSGVCQAAVALRGARAGCVRARRTGVAYLHVYTRAEFPWRALRASPRTRPGINACAVAERASADARDK